MLLQAPSASSYLPTINTMPIEDNIMEAAASASGTYGDSTLMMAAGCATAVLLSALFLIKKESFKRNQSTSYTTENNNASSNKKKLDKSKYPGGRITIYYATQTGTAESFAQQLEREGPDYGFFIHVVDFEDVLSLDQMLEQKPFDDVDDSDDDSPCRAIILAATYGEGEPTDNSAGVVSDFKEYTESGEDDIDKLFENKLDYTVFGLGNRQYEHYNEMGIFFDKQLEQLGANRVYKLGMGDDDVDLEADFESWKDQLWTSLQTKYGVKMSEDSKKKKDDPALELPKCEYDIEYLVDPSVETDNIMDIPIDKVHGSSRHYFTSVDCPVTTLKELRNPNDGGSTVHMEIDISHSDEIKYETADNLGVLPVNSASVVESVAKSLGYDLDQVFQLKAAEDHEWHGLPFPQPLTVRECLTRYLDLTSAPRRSDLKQLIPYAKDIIDRKCLTRLSSKEGKAEYKEKIVESYKGIVDLLKLCPSLEIPLEHLISVCKLLLPRYYTISSSSNVYPNSIHITVSVTEEDRSDGSKFFGVCSNYLATLSPQQKTLSAARVFVRPSTFRLPADTTKPILMIGPGTGIAPMRALLQERQHQKSVENKSVGPNILYFGCKKPNLDYLYESELAAFKKDGILDELHLAFSRETTQKVYVQHLLANQSKQTWNLLDKDGVYIYVCGGVKMGHDVTEALQEILVNEGQMSFGDAKDYLAKMASTGRYVQELWA